MLTGPSLLSRREFLTIGGAAALSSLLPWRWTMGADGIREYRLRPQPATVPLAESPFPPTKVWAFNGQIPGPMIRARKGERIRIIVNNALPEPTTVHWHGLRIENAMDGVPHLTQQPIATGSSFVYEYAPPDAGTFWYHSHYSTAEQVGRGLYGPLIVDEPEPLQVDRDIVWVLDDWRLTKDAQIKEDFHNPDDFARSGRIGNTITLNGRAPTSLAVRAGERIRLRLINAANARIFLLRFQGHTPHIVALDGQPTEPYVPPHNAVLLGPAQRVDLILDMEGKPGERFSVIDGYFPQAPFRVIDLSYADETPLRESPLDAPLRLPPGNLAEPSMADLHRQDVLLDGGDLGRLEQAYLKGEKTAFSELFLLGKMWAINGVSGFSTENLPPLVDLPLGSTCLLRFNNRTAWPHPMHLHGFHFKVLSHQGDPNMVGRTHDTVLLGPEEQAEVAFVADNPGDWFFHCHILSHAEAGMMAVLRVT